MPMINTGKSGSSLYKRSRKQIDTKYGGRTTFKTSTNAEWIIIDMLMNPGCEAVVLRQTATAHRETTLKALLSAMSRLGLTQEVHYTLNKTTMQITLYPNGQKIYFLQAQYPEINKGFEPTPGNYIGIVWGFEITELSDRVTFEQNLAHFRRGHKPFWKIYVEFNVPDGWIPQWLDDTRDTNHATYTNIEMVPESEKAWVGKGTLDEAENMKAKNPALYDYIYMGHPLISKKIFPFDEFDKIDIASVQYSHTFIVIDPKSTGEDFFGVAWFGVSYSGDLVLLGCIFTDERLTDKLIQQTADFIKKASTSKVYIEVNKEYTLALELERRTGINLEGFHTTQNKTTKILDNAVPILRTKLSKYGDDHYNRFIDNLVNWHTKAKHDDAVDLMAMAQIIRRKSHETSDQYEFYSIHK